MKYYYRYPGDITIKTGHLTPAEMGCYDRLMDHCYSTEAPIPAGRAHSICRALTEADQAACDNVLREFFSLVEGGWVQQRIGEEIVKAQGRITAARENGKKGGRPPKAAPGDTDQKPTGFSTETQPGAQDATQQKALQTPTIDKRPKGLSSAGADKPEPDPQGFLEFWGAWPSTDRKQDRKKCVAKWRRCGFAKEADRIVAHVNASKETRAWREGFEPAPLTYLNGERWRDGPPVSDHQAALLKQGDV